MTSFFETLVSTRERMFNKEFNTYMSEAFEDSSERLMEMLPLMKAELLNQACDRSLNIISTSFSVNLNGVFEEMDAAMYITIQLPKRYKFILQTKNNEVLFFISNKANFSTPKEHEVIIYYLNEFVPEIKEIKKLLHEHFDGDVKIECKIEPKDNDILFNYIVSYNLETYV